MADNYLTCALRLSPDQEWDRVVFSGGLAQKLERLREMITAQFSCPYRLFAATEDTLIALMAQALVIDERQPNMAAALDNLQHQSGTL